MAASDPLGDLIKKLEEIQPLAATVATLRQSTVEEETAALNAILEKIRPLLSLTAHSIAISYHTSGQQFSTDHREYHAQKGLILINEFDEECTDRDTRGDYTGWKLILWEDGSFGTLERSGDWSRWQGESSGWSITEEEDLTTEEAVRRYGLKDIMAGLVSELSDASEKLEGRKADYEERLATITRIKEVMA
jgi:hypothetical protein